MKHTRYINIMCVRCRVVNVQASVIYRLVMTKGERVKYRTYNSELF